MIISSFSSFRKLFATTTSVDNSGYEIWPVELVRIGDFPPESLFLAPFPVESATYVISANEGVQDGTPHVDEYDWYVSQRTDILDQQGLVVTQFGPILGNTFSGTIGLSLSSSYNIALHEADEADLIKIFKSVTVYVRKKSSGGILLAHPLDVLLGVPQAA